MITEKQQYDISSNPDAVAWAKLYKQTCDILGKECDEEWMIAWFANAMMAMHDHIHNTKDVRDKTCACGVNPACKCET